MSSVKTQNIGRSIPAVTARKTLRDHARYGAGMLLSLALLASCSKNEHKENADLSSPDAGSRIEAEIADFEGSFDLEVVLINSVEYTTPLEDNSYDLDSYEILGQAFFLEDFEAVRNKISKTFDAAGDFSLKPGAQLGNPEDYFENAKIPPLDEINPTLANKVSGFYKGRLANPIPTYAFASSLNFGEDAPERVCSTLFIHHTVDEQEFLASFAGGRTDIDVEYVELQQFVANHELAHCVNSVYGMQTWMNETLADAYALTRHMQLNGDDNLPEVILHSRQLSSTAHKDTDHYTTPGLEGFIHKLREANANGDLENLDPQELRNLSVILMFGEDTEAYDKTVQPLVDEMAQIAEVMPKLDEYVTADNTGRYTIKDDAPENGLGIAQEIVSRQNAAVDYLGPNLENIPYQDIDPEYAEQRYRATLAEYAQTQPSAEIALEGVRYKLWNMAQIEHQTGLIMGDTGLRELYQTHDYTGLRFTHKQQILEEFELELKQSPEIVMRPAKTPSHER